MVAAGSPIAALTSGHVAALTDGVLKTMFLNRLKTLVALIPVLGLVALGAGLLTPGGRNRLRPPPRNAFSKTGSRRTARPKTSDGWRP
jgi:hypothetical protein